MNNAGNAVSHRHTSSMSSTIADPLGTYDPSREAVGGIFHSLYIMGDDLRI